jgi:hypothetical protein
VPVFGKNIYVATSLSAIATAQRNTKVLAFEPLVASTTQRVSGCSKEAYDIIQFNIDGSQGDRGYVITFFKNIHPPLAPGESLNHMNRVMIQNIANSADALATSPRRIKLGQWLRHEVTLATTNSVYGPANPLLDCEVENGFWFVQQTHTHVQKLIREQGVRRTSSWSHCECVTLSHCAERHESENRPWEGIPALLRPE